MVDRRTVSDIPDRWKVERRVLQLAVASIAVFPLTLGATLTLTGLHGFAFLFGLGALHTLNPTYDSALRFLAANFFGMGLVMVWTIPRIERAGAVFRIATATMVIGATGRLISMSHVGRPNGLTLVLTIVESSGIGLLIWQGRVARGCRGHEVGQGDG